LVLHIFEVIS